MCQNLVFYGAMLFNSFFYWFSTLLEEEGCLGLQQAAGRGPDLGLVLSVIFVSAYPSFGTFSGDGSLQLPLHSGVVLWTCSGQAAPNPLCRNGDRSCSVVSGRGGFHPPVVPGDTAEFAVKRTG